jgi:hypothetical protein
LYCKELRYFDIQGLDEYVFSVALTVALRDAEAKNAGCYT